MCESARSFYLIPPLMLAISFRRNCKDAKLIRLHVFRIQGRANEFGQAPDFAEPDKSDLPDL